MVDMVGGKREDEKYYKLLDRKPKGRDQLVK
jgi:hypothetical protein